MCQPPLRRHISVLSFKFGTASKLLLIQANYINLRMLIADGMVPAVGHVLILYTMNTRAPRSVIQGVAILERMWVVTKMVIFV